jgi:hypothetical protein
VSDYERFAEGVAALHGTGCYLCRVLAARSAPVPSRYMRCEGIVEPHHLLPKRLLRREFGRGTLLVYDPRTSVPVRRWHHDLLEWRRVELLVGEWPAAALEFAAEHGLMWWVDRLRERQGALAA